MLSKIYEKFLCLCKRVLIWQGLRDSELAVLIDAENVSPAVAEEAIGKAKELSRELLIIAFADWRRAHEPLRARYREMASRHGLCQQHVCTVNKLKNGSDNAIAYHAGRLSKTVGAILIVSHDRDFLYLIRALGQDGVAVYGAGTAVIAADLRKAFARFFVCGNGKKINYNQVTALSATEMAALRRLLATACVAVTQERGHDGWVRMSDFGQHLRLKSSEYSLPPGMPKKLSALVRLFPDTFETMVYSTDHWVRVKKDLLKQSNCHIIDVFDQRFRSLPGDMTYSSAICKKVDSIPAT